MSYYFIDEDEIYNNSNLHPEEQDELEIPDGTKFIKSIKKYFNSCCNNCIFIFRYLNTSVPSKVKTF